MYNRNHKIKYGSYIMFIHMSTMCFNRMNTEILLIAIFSNKRRGELFIGGNRTNIITMPDLVATMRLTFPLI